MAGDRERFFIFAFCLVPFRLVMDSDHDLEQLIDRELAQLPELRAPRTLLPRVMHATGVAHPAAGGWFTWPLAWQALSLASMVVIVLGAANVWPVAADTLAALLSALSGDSSSRLGSAIRHGEAIVAAADTMWRVAQPVVLGMLALVASMCAACAMFGAALRNVVLGGPSRL
jgi:type VI protein secretion system component VasF